MIFKHAMEVKRLAISGQPSAINGLPRADARSGGWLKADCYKPSPVPFLFKF
jgi:hypothetical protein